MTNEQIIERLRAALDERGPIHTGHIAVSDVEAHWAKNSAEVFAAVSAAAMKEHRENNPALYAAPSQPESIWDDLTTRETDLEMLRSIGSHVRKSGLSKDEDIIRELRKGLDEPTTRETVE